MFEVSEGQMENEMTNGAKIKVIGVGGGGCNAVNTMIKDGLTGVEYIVANTDAQALSINLAPTKVQLGHDITKGLGAGANPEVGRKAALDDYEKLTEVLDGADMVFITAGMGGGTGTGAAPVIAKLAKELGALTVGVVTKPFLFEGKRRSRQAEEGITTLEESVDSLITIPNQRLLYIAGDSLSLVDTFKKADEVLLNAVRGISDLINNTGHINADFADVKTVMANTGLSLMGTGMCQGPDRAIKAATEAISSPLLEDITIDGATGIIINITGNESMTMHEANEATTLIMEAADEDAEIIFGTVIDDSMDDNIKVTVIATGLAGTRKAIRSTPRVTESQTQTETHQHVATQNESRVESTDLKNFLNTDTKETKASNHHNMNTEESIVTSSVQHSTPTTVSEKPSVQNVSNEASSLMASIQQAAKKYNGNEENHEVKTSEPSHKETSHTEAYRPSYPNRGQNTHSQSNQQSVGNISSKTKSIAEKLGFLNFDEEELDKPTFLRNEEDQRP